MVAVTLAVDSVLPTMIPTSLGRTGKYAVPEAPTVTVWL